MADSFIDQYKRVEKLCGDMLGVPEHGVTAYIEQMEATPAGESSAAGWKEDYKKLKHCRWARNRIVHDPGCTQENTCEPGDLEWLTEFGRRLMGQDDPLARFRKAELSRRGAARGTTKAGTSNGSGGTYQNSRSSRRNGQYGKNNGNRYERRLKRKCRRVLRQIIFWVICAVILYILYRTGIADRIR